MKIEPMLVVKSVSASSQFYQSALGLESAHGGDEFEMLMHDGKLVLQLHHQEPDEHTGLWEAGVAPGNGVALWFRTVDFEGAVAMIRQASATIVAEPHVNPNAQQHEIWFRDPDGYLVVVSNNFGDARK